MNIISQVPFPLKYRELWLPDRINADSTLPASVLGGHALTFTGTKKGTTADGVHFTGAATSNLVVAANAIRNAKAALHITIRFKPDTTFATGASGNQYFINQVTGTSYVRAYLKTTDGKFYWEQDDGAAGAGFSLTSTTASWTEGAPYIVTVEMTDTPTQRLLVNGVLQDSDTSAAVATPDGGDLIIGSSSDGGTDGFVGTISWVVIGVGATATVALTTDEEADLAKGIQPATAKVQYMFLFDEGRGVTLYDRGSAGGNATLDTACTWAWGQVKQPCLSSDGINDQARSATGINLDGNVSIVWAGKIKSNYTLISATADTRQIIYARGISGSYEIYLRSATGVTGVQVLVYAGAGKTIAPVDVPAMDDYRIFILTLNTSWAIQEFSNGSLVGSNILNGPFLSGASAFIDFGGSTTATYYDNSKMLFAGIVEGAFTATQAKIYSRWLRDRMNLPITI